MTENGRSQRLLERSESQLFPDTRLRGRSPAQKRDAAKARTSISIIKKQSRKALLFMTRIRKRVSVSDVPDAIQLIDPTASTRIIGSRSSVSFSWRLVM